MPVYLLNADLVFPPPEHAEDGLLAVGGDLSPERLVLAYSSGIFPWYDEGYPILWHSPDPRCVIRTRGIHVGRTLRRAIRQRRYDVRVDRDFAGVVRGCKEASRPGQGGTWITDDMEAAYGRLHALGLAHSFESYSADGRLVGGVYGVSLGRMFFGESMFATESDASKVAFVALAWTLASWGFPIIDAQVPTDHTVSLGAEEWPRARFLEVLREELSAAPTRRGSWADVEPVLTPPA